MHSDRMLAVNSPGGMKRKRESDTMSASEKLAALRSLMQAHMCDVFIVPSEDAHMSEYVAACDERRAYLSGFDGSAGTVVVTQSEALCWTDGRYFVQAQSQLDPTCFKMMRLHEDVGIDQWLSEHVPEGSVIVVDATTISVSAFERMRECLSSRAASNVTLATLPSDVGNFVDTVWGDSRPSTPSSNVFCHPLKYAGKSTAEKLENIRTHMECKHVDVLVITALDEIAWLFNLRGSDVEYNPVFWSYCTIEMHAVKLYANSSRFADDVVELLRQDGVSVQPYHSVFSDLANLPDGSQIWIDPASCNYAIVKAIKESSKERGTQCKVIKSQGPIPLQKACKNSVELQGMRNAHIRDGVAMVKFLCWLESEIKAGKTPTECEAADKLDGLRAAQDLFVSLSFPTISSSGSNGAIVHYRPRPESCAKIDSNSVYLVDSGAQYRDGTTDVTRTMHFGKPSEWEKECFTRVLRGHIALDTAVFPKGTTGHILDAFARKPLWERGLDYKHGTGHGVGCFLNVHEGPHVLSFKPAAQVTALEPGFLTSNEPGYYEPAAEHTQGFGIRIENVCVIAPANSISPSDRPFYTLEHLTLVPLQTKMMDVTIMTGNECRWVDDYNAECLEKLSPLLQDDPLTLQWLQANTNPIFAC